MVMMDDALRDIFRLIRLKSCVYFQRDFCAPWAMEISGTGFAQFHVVTRGSGILELAGRQIGLGPGDVLLFPRGAAHTLADAPQRRAVAGAEVMSSFAGDDPLFSDGPFATRLICGHFEFHNNLAHPLIGQLPDLVHVRALDMMPQQGPLSILPILMRELSDANPGNVSVVERLAEVLLVQTLRAYYADHPHESAFYAALNDARLARAVSLIHRDPAKPLTLDLLAREAGMSRSLFAQEFKARTGIAPIEYLARWRMLNAADIIRTEGLSLSEVAARSGYESDISLSRAFKRALGVTPSEYRRQEI